MGVGVGLDVGGGYVGSSNNLKDQAGGTFQKEAVAEGRSLERSSGPCEVPQIRPGGCAISRVAATNSPLCRGES